MDEGLEAAMDSLSQDQYSMLDTIEKLQQREIAYLQTIDTLTAERDEALNRISILQNSLRESNRIHMERNQRLRDTLEGIKKIRREPNHGDWDIIEKMIALADKALEASE